MSNKYTPEFKKKVQQLIDDEDSARLYEELHDWVEIEDAGQVLDIDSLVTKGSLENKGPSLLEMRSMEQYNIHLHSVLASSVVIEEEV